MSRTAVFLCSTNSHKVAELSAILGPDVKVLTPKDLGQPFQVLEDGVTFEANALKKAMRGQELSGFPSLADDSGLCVDALGGAPGVHSARFAHDHGAGEGDEANNRLLLDRMRDMPDAERTARFVCVLALCKRGTAPQTFRGELVGRIGRTPQGKNGFGYDPLFVLDDGRALATLPASEKNLISHRAKALQAARPSLLEYLR